MNSTIRTQNQKENMFELVKKKEIFDFLIDDDTSNLDVYTSFRDNIIIGSKLLDFNVQEILSHTKLIGIRTKTDVIYMLETLSDNIVELNDMTFFDSIEIIKELSTDKYFYGALLIDSSGRQFNPLHPIVADKLIYELSINVNMHKEKFDLFLYSHNDIIDSYIEKIGKSREDLIENLIINSLAISKSKENIISKITGNITTESDAKNIYISNIIDGDMIEKNLYKKIKLESDENSTDDFFLLVPNQKIVDGIAYPYYGTSLINIKENSTYVKGLSIGTMLGGNVYINDSDSEYIFDSVCTGDILDTSIEGIETLNCVNMRSAYTDYILTAGWDIHAKKSIEISLSLYDEYMKTLIVKKTYKDIYFEDNPEATLSTYAQHMREKILTKRDENNTITSKINEVDATDSTLIET